MFFFTQSSPAIIIIIAIIYLLYISKARGLVLILTQCSLCSHSSFKTIPKAHSMPRMGKTCPFTIQKHELFKLMALITLVSYSENWPLSNFGLLFPVVSFVFVLWFIETVIYVKKVYYLRTVVL